jgi:hypothetical protein
MVSSLAEMSPPRFANSLGYPPQRGPYLRRLGETILYPAGLAGRPHPGTGTAWLSYLTEHPDDQALPAAVDTTRPAGEVGAGAQRVRVFGPQASRAGRRWAGDRGA